MVVDEVTIHISGKCRRVVYNISGIRNHMKEESVNI